MISNELAKQLKIAGYPQGDSILDLHYPSLEELIAGCKDFFYRLEKDGDKWSAIARIPENVMCRTCPKGNQVITETANTAEIAMAMLWIRLKKW